MFKPSLVILALVACATAISQSSTFIDSSTGITFQRVQTGTDGSSVAIALPPQGAAASDAIIQLTGPASHSFAAISLNANSEGSIFGACCWCCTNARSIHGAFRQPRLGAHHIGNGPNKAPAVLTPIGEAEITPETFKFTFRCQNCTISETKGSKISTLTAIFSNKEVSSISDLTFKVDPTKDIITNVQVNLAEARIANYWSFVDRP